MAGASVSEWGGAGGGRAAVKVCPKRRWAKSTCKGTRRVQASGSGLGLGVAGRQKSSAQSAGRQRAPVWHGAGVVLEAVPGGARVVRSGSPKAEVGKQHLQGRMADASVRAMGK